MAGIWKHKKVWLRVHHPDYFDKYRLKSDRVVNVINLKQLEDLAAREGSDLDLGKMGYTKLLSTGSVSTPLKVSVPQASKKAVEKIESAGGSVELS